MRKIITIAILLFSVATYAQGNLQFNRVRTYTGRIFHDSYVLFDTVPSGKVWKIEAAGLTTTVTLNINGRNYNNIYGNSVIKETIWLKAGDILGISCPWLGHSNTSSWDYVVSIIEYNIIP